MTNSVAPANLIEAIVFIMLFLAPFVTGAWLAEYIRGHFFRYMAWLCFFSCSFGYSLYMQTMLCGLWDIHSKLRSERINIFGILFIAENVLSVVSMIVIFKYRRPDR